MSRHIVQQEEASVELPSRRLDPRMLRAWYAGSLTLVVGTVAVGLAAMLIVRHFGGPILVPLIIMGVALVIELADMAISPRVEYATWRFDVTSTDIDLYHGVFVKKRVIVPLVRVQHVETKQGPILKANGLAVVRISTAGGGASRFPGSPKTMRGRCATALRSSRVLPKRTYRTWPGRTIRSARMRAGRRRRGWNLIAGRFR